MSIKVLQLSQSNSQSVILRECIECHFWLVFFQRIFFKVSLKVSFKVLLKVLFKMLFKKCFSKCYSKCLPFWRKCNTAVNLATINHHSIDCISSSFQVSPILQMHIATGKTHVGILNEQTCRASKVWGGHSKVWGYISATSKVAFLPKRCSQKVLLIETVA